MKTAICAYQSSVPCKVTLLIRGDLGQIIKVLPILTLKGPLNTKLLLSPVLETDRRKGLSKEQLSQFYRFYENPTINQSVMLMIS